MVSRTILIHSEARKNKSYRHKYFVLSVGENYCLPRLHYFSGVDKWNQQKHQIGDDISDDLSYKTIDLSRLFFVDDVHRSKPKHGGLDLYMEDRHVSIVLSSEDLKKKWREMLDNVVYKNGKTHAYPLIEHALQVCLRLKPREHFDKDVLQLWRGDFRACFLRTSLIFIDKNLEKPTLIIQYPFIRQWESRLDGTLRLEVGRAAMIGECVLVMALSDHAESQAAHLMLTNCINKFKLSRPEPPRVRANGDNTSSRNGCVSSCRRSSLGVTNCSVSTSRSNSCVGFFGDSGVLVGSPTSSLKAADTTQNQEEDSYTPMNIVPVEGEDISRCAQNCFEHVSRICKCPVCDSFTKFITFCSKCSDSSAPGNFGMLCRKEVFLNSFSSNLQASIRDKAQSLTERPTLPSLSLKTAKQKKSFSYPSKSGFSQTNHSSSKESTNEMSSSRLVSQRSLVSSNRHDDDLFMELDFQGILPSKKPPTHSRTRLQCGHCSSSLEPKGAAEWPARERCPRCSSDMLSLSLLIEGPQISSQNLGRPADCPGSVSDYVEVQLATLWLDSASF